MRKLAGLVLLVCIVFLGVEAVCSYVLYRHYGNLQRSFSPSGSATMTFALALKARFLGRHDQTALSIDHGPLFRTDPILGYAMYPGAYRITEKSGDLIHRFSLNVDEFGHRATSNHPKAGKRMYFTGDSAMFGWGLNDEQTIPWLLQTRFPNYDVVNLSLNSYSTVHAILQLQQATPGVTADDIVVLSYHLITNDFNVAASTMISYLEDGFERQLGEVKLVRDMMVPYGSVDAHGEFMIRRYAIACALRQSTLGECSHPALSTREAMQVTMRAFDALIAASPAHFVVAFLSGDDSDPVIAHLKAKGVAVADLRTSPSDPDASDVLSINGHSGPFWHYNSAERLAQTLRGAHLGD